MNGLACTVFVLGLAGSSGSAAAPADIPSRLTAPIAQAVDAARNTPGGTPAMAAVIVQGDAAPWFHVVGQRRADRDAPADPDTRFYIASQTKSFMALLAAELDARGVLPLDTTLAQVWPALHLPAPADPRRITLADLLSHQEGLSTDTLNLLTAHVRDVPAVDYPRLLATETRSRAAGFRYANLGDLIYGAALEARTGRSWHAWLDRVVLQPLELSGISSRTSTVQPDRLAWNHQWDGTRWHVLPPKPDALMHAAGGLVASPRAMARWMRIQLGTVDTSSVLHAGALARAQRMLAQAHLSDGEIDCDGYSLGWYRCRYRGEQALMHPGSYDGAVSVTVLVPSVHAGMSLMANSDSAMETLQLVMMKAFIGLATGHADEAERLRHALDRYPAQVRAKARTRMAAIAKARSDLRGSGRPWHPDAAALDACTGSYDDPLFGVLRIERRQRHLVARLDALRLDLEPVTANEFLATTETLDPPAPLRCDAAAGQVEWRGRVFRRE